MTIAALRRVFGGEDVLVDGVALVRTVALHATDARP